MQTDKIIAADERIATAMEGTLGQSKQALDATIDNFHLEQRAWVGPVRVLKQFDAGGKIVNGLGMIVTNTGKTPALNVVTFMGMNTILVHNRNLPKVAEYTFNYPSPVSGQPFGSKGVLQPSMEVAFSPSFQEENAKAERIKDGFVLLYMHGLMTYDDVYTRPHTTKFCVYFEPDLSAAHSCPTYNEAD